MKIIVRVLLVALVFLFFFGIARSRAQFYIFGNPLEGKPAPEFTLSTLKKTAITMSQSRDKKPALIFFWAIQCPHCREALEDLNMRAVTLESKGLKVLLVNVAEEREDVEEYLGDQGIVLDTFLDENGTVARDYYLIGVPTFFLIDKKGIIKSAEHSFPEDFQTLLESSD